MVVMSCLVLLFKEGIIISILRLNHNFDSGSYLNLTKRVFLEFLLTNKKNRRRSNLMLITIILNKPAQVVAKSRYLNIPCRIKNSSKLKFCCSSK